MAIPFTKPFLTGNEIPYITKALANNKLCGDGNFSKQCQNWLEKQTGCKKALLTPSCTAALEMAAILIDVKPGDEIIMPSYTFVSGANAFVLRGGVPVFVDIRADTMNLDENKIAAAITKRTKAIAPMHYCGIGCAMDKIMAIAKQHNLYVIEDAAQGIMASYNNQPLGAIGHLGTLSFHGTKNITAGEGGAILINDASLMERAEIIREKGTDRSKFLLGQIDKYTWIDIGSSFLASEITAAFLLAQLEQAENITKKRLAIWQQYHEGLKELEQDGLIKRMSVPHNCQANAHIYYLLLKDAASQNLFCTEMRNNHIDVSSHYVPLHLAPGGKKYGRTLGALPIAENLAERLVRLPIYPDIAQHVPKILKIINEIIHRIS